MKSKFKIFIILISLIATMAAGCSKTVATVSASASISTANRLALGTIKLEGTSQAVTHS